MTAAPQPERRTLGSIRGTAQPKPTPPNDEPVLVDEHGRRYYHPVNGDRVVHLVSDTDEAMRPIQPATSGWPTLHPAAMHGPLGEIVRTLAPHTEADPVALLADLLVSFGNCVGSGPHALADASRHPARLNAVLVGQTARGRKGTARANIGALFEETSPDWATKRVMGGLSTGEGLIAAVRDPMSDDDKDAPKDKRLLVYEPEFARVLAVAGRDGNVLSAIIRDAWDTGRLRVMTRKDPLVATDAHISVLGHITVEELERRLSDTEAANGFANRFLFVCVRRSKLLPDGGNLHPDEFVRLVRLLRMALEGGRKVGRVVRDEEARTLWASMYEEAAANEQGGLVGAVTARAEAQLLRLSVTYALADGTGTVTPAHLRAAWAMWEYAEASARFVFGDALGDPVADKLLAALKQAGEAGLTGVEQRDVFNRHVTSDQLGQVRTRLEGEKKIISVLSPSGGGRPALVSFLSPYAHKAQEAQEGAWR